MIVVIDTNSLLVSIGRKSPYNKVFQSIFSGKINLAVSTEILNEYHEIIGKQASPSIADNVLEAILKSPHIIFCNVYFRWNLITIDPDDNKFIDTYVSGKAVYLITNDHHFDILKNLDFPKVNIIKLDSFVKLLD